MSTENNFNRFSVIEFYGFCDFDIKHYPKIPMILFLGRENNNKPKEYEIEKISYYNFKESPKSVFYNRSYSLISRCLTQNSLNFNFKRAVFESNYSPVLFSNAYPVPIENTVSNGKKNKIRKQHQYLSNDHLAYIFSNVISLNIKMIILSLLPFNSFDNIIEDVNSYEKEILNIIREYCKNNSIIFIHLPYFAQNLANEKIDVNITTNKKIEIAKIIQEAYL